nr:hypothetical protein [Tanacetum cinerariifolium]
MDFFMIKNLTYLISMSLVLFAIPLMTVKTLPSITDIEIFVGYAPAKKAFRIYNKRTHLFIETTHVDFDELSAMGFEQFSSRPGPKLVTPRTISPGLMPNVPFSTLTTENLMFDPHVPAVIALEPIVSTGTPSSTIIDQDGPSTSTSQIPPETPSPDSCIALTAFADADHAGCQDTRKKYVWKYAAVRMILDNFTRVEGVNFIDVPDDDTTLTYLIKLGYKGEDYQGYRLAILEVMLNDAIKQFESYWMFIKYSTGQIPPGRSEEKVKRNTASRRVVKNKITLFVDDNIIIKDPDVALELDKSISLTEAEEAKAARKVHATHVRIVTEYVHESTKKKSGGRSSRGVAIQDTPCTLKPKPDTSKSKLKGTRGLSKGTGTIQGVLDKSIVVSATSSDEAGTKPGVPDKEVDITEENVILDWGSEQESEYLKEDQLNDEEKDYKVGDADDEGDDHIRDIQDTDDETKSNEDEIYKYKIRVHKDEDEEMLNAKVEYYGKGDAKVSNEAKTMHANKSFNRNPANHILYHAIIEALIEDENSMDKGVADIVKDHKRKHDADEDDYDEDPPIGPNQGKKIKRRRTKEPESSKMPSTTKETPKGKASSKGSKTGKSASAKEPIEVPTVEVVMDDEGKDVVRDYDQPQDTFKPKIAKTPNPEWFMQPSRPSTPAPEWNKRQVVLDQPEQPWFNKIVSATKDPLTFNDLMATPIDFSKYVLNRLKIDNLTQDVLLRHLTIAVDYFFNNDLEYLKYFDPDRTYTTSITKTKAARYEIEGIEDTVPTLWSPTKVGVKSVSVKKLHGYGHLEEIVVKRADHQLYKFKEGDFIDLHMIDIKDMLLLGVQQKLFHLTDSDIFTLLWLFLCSQEVSSSRNRTLKKVQDELYHRVLDIDLRYNKEMSRRMWTVIKR